MTTIKFNFLFFLVLSLVSCSNLPTKDQTATVKQESTTLDHRAGFLGKMSSSHMQSLNAACMKSQNNQKKCDDKLMQDCNLEMSKMECQKMMAEAKL